MHQTVHVTQALGLGGIYVMGSAFIETKIEIMTQMCPKRRIEIQNSYEIKFIPTQWESNKTSTSKSIGCFQK